MNDLALWRQLSRFTSHPGPGIAGEPCDAWRTSIEDIEELAERPFRERLPYLAGAVTLLADERPAMRRAALRVLNNASGTRALEAVRQALDDDDEQVRRTALETLPSSREPWLWMFPLLHRRPEMRRLGLQLLRDRGKDSPLVLQLLADPLMRDDALQHLQETTIRQLPLPLLMDLHGRDLLSDEEVRQLLGCCGPLAWGALDEIGYPPDLARRILSEEADEQALSAWNPLQWVLELHWREATRESLRALESVARHINAGELFAAAALVTARRQGHWNARIVGLCATGYPPVLARDDIPLAVKRTALTVLHELATCQEADSQTLCALLNGELCRHEDGGLDLWAVGAVMAMRRKCPYQLVLELYDEQEIVAAFWRDPVRALSLFRHPGNNTTRIKLLNLILDHRSDLRQPASFVHALLAQIMPSDGLPQFAAGLSDEELAAMLVELMSIAKVPELALSNKKHERLAQVVGERIGVRELVAFWRVWLSDAPRNFLAGRELLVHVARHRPIEWLLEAIDALPDDLLETLLSLIPGLGGFPYGVEMQLALHLRDHLHAPARDWARARIASPERRTSTLDHGSDSGLDSGPDLDAELATAIRCCAAGDLSTAVEPCLQAARRGLTAALLARADVGCESLHVCAALIAGNDPLAESDAMFSRYRQPHPAPDFLSRLDRLVVWHWRHHSDISTLGHAWLHNWEFHSNAFAERAMQDQEQTIAWLQLAHTLDNGVLGEQIWRAVASVLGTLRMRDKPRARELFGQAFLQTVVDGLVSDFDEVAASMLSGMHLAKFELDLLEQFKPQVNELLPSLSKAARERLSAWVDSRGLAATVVARRPQRTESNEELRRRIEVCADFDALERWCCEHHPGAATDAGLRLLELGAAGIKRLLKILGQTEPAPCALLLAETVALWPAELLPRARELARSDAAPSVRFIVALNLAELGEREHVELALDIARLPSDPSWLQVADVKRLIALRGVEEVADRLVDSPHPHGYRFAVNVLLAVPRLTPEAPATDRLRLFLEQGTQRDRSLRVQVARKLAELDDFWGFPILLSEAYNDEPAQRALETFPDPYVLPAVACSLLAGNKHCREDDLCQLTLPSHTTHDGWSEQRREAATLLLTDLASESLRQQIAARLKPTGARSRKLRQVAETFAEGIALGRELTGRLFAVHLIGGDDLGYTRLNENRIYINPLPILRDQPHGREVVRALILHELGHHIYHRGQEQQAVWERASDEGLQRLLNLVADEHLERNLRALDSEFGDQLKRLAAFAFQHQRRDLNASWLIERLQSRAFETLSQIDLEVGRKPCSVRVDSGSLLHELERCGSSFSRFFRALRMGLGDRHNDPRVAAALALFPRSFRRSSMTRLLEITRQLREIFGNECSLLDALDSDELGAAESCEIPVKGEGLTNEELQREIHRVTKAPVGGGGDDGRPSNRFYLNVGETADFEAIDHVVRLPCDRRAYAPYARMVARDAAQFRRYLLDLGVTLEPQRRRLRGRRLDRAGLSNSVLRRDPRMLVAREPRRHTDLFLGVVIDCSGSMSFADNIEKAKLFAAMLAEATRDCAGIDLRIFGFTDETIYDAGDQRHPGIAALSAGGGNNDAAALWHAARVAMSSKRAAKLLVMISDGLPTECSVDALRSLVARLARRGFCCAQVAVAPLEEICFPNYIELSDTEQASAVRRFGVIVARLVRKALRA
ncbi:MAG: VWA domain-containing protein [Planctomycetales bacterium]|nr:VWA domain-containing protein [Planctomycetales bacterium]